MKVLRENIRAQCEEALGRLREKLFDAQAKLTLVMRSPMTDAELVVTDDDLQLVEQSVRQRREALEAGEKPEDSPLMLEYEDHCDSVIINIRKPMALRWFLFVNRLPALDKMLCFSNDIDPKLFAKYKGKWHRVVMASRFGDVGITTDLKADHGYSVRVSVKDLSEFTDQTPFPA